jgi:HD superfamily phosphohydrolase
MLDEVAALDRSGSLVRIPPATDVPLSQRVRRLIDTAPLRRLHRISQLGMVSLVYPGATHSRMEHTLGVYYNALCLLARFAEDPAFAQLVGSPKQEAFVLAALLHDIGHWPFCHPIEDMRLEQVGEHESRVAHWMQNSEIAECVSEDWSCDVEDVVALLDPHEGGGGRIDDPTNQFLASCLSGPIDVDKLDYLPRDSMHAGVPYGRNFDVGRLIGSMCVHPTSPRLAISEKGRTAAEMMVFSRYIMFSEVYWHHAVRAATAMLQRAVFLLQHRIDIDASLRLDDNEWTAMMRRTAAGSVAEPLIEGLFGRHRCLYKRAAEFHVIDGGEVHRRLARRPYWWLVACAERLASALAQRTGHSIHAVDLLIDAPPMKLEVDINIDVVRHDGSVHGLAAVSPVASALAFQQFDDHVKRVRIFVRGDLRDILNETVSDWQDELTAVIDSLESEFA